MSLDIKKYFCRNDECGHKTFVETFDFFAPNATKTKRLSDEILKVSLTQSSVAAAKYLRDSVCDVGKSTICNMLKKSKTVIEKDKVFAVCIDDFALKKRQRYGTVVADLHSHKIVDMIESREKNDVSAWLMEYPNIQIVFRDGSRTYANAISKSHPQALQIADRFHILKNLSDYATKALQKIFQSRVSIPITGNT